ncbi:2,3-bisphosphoglycerate-independent phosphoglycerate mutase, putative [Entamoeba invadens IP1]|uniref:phosphoglycerate mutase (2,3-diphosphoglycerate-independent) n=1 Tax=Entamoeba invadens TaxID=33085 RepID=S0B5S6_ENTIV|nr:2,3-bisphosphoglycerate-independent phosphoglycerate mutase, putative [Entamoeba invadens IP1]ELP93163.1 2,3-bisphosphoglycerate-independent phosphoglycerate mutase, putative [Entamoeba invadens IP1]BAN41936.1 2,3-bisphosphoglycerate-independent phosphoglycerate mutase, putative [Entamoeba invadens]|eukprot:XP_004259934.1 2,3-bisphosphoglycerate-independent phosphoglycerate mutase, putative [Entamoeba invadens IP1]
MAALKVNPKYKPREGPVVVVILDGFGIDKAGPGNCVTLANPPTYNRMLEEAKKENMHVIIKANGPYVGLPTDADMGNSEVGHNALGAGQIYSQGTKLVEESIESGRFFETENWKNVVGKATEEGKTVHFIGLLSDGNVHSNTTQLFQMMDGVVKSGGKKIRVHPLLDGRDVAPDSGLFYLEKLEKKLAELQGKGIDAKIASGGGRMHITMDRYEADWAMVERGWMTHVRGMVPPCDITPEYTGYYHSAKEAVELARKLFPKKLDQFNPAFVIVDEQGKPIGKIQDGDAVIDFNFRGDRAIEISKAFTLPNEQFKYFDRIEFPTVRYAGLLEYDSDNHIPPNFLCAPPDIKHVSSEYLVHAGVKCYAIAETHKYGHVTYFWNGNKTGYFDDKLELYEQIKSLSNDLTESNPEMKAQEVCDRLVQRLKEKQYKYYRVNFANPDMVGHTGNIESGVKAVLKCDECLKTLEQTIKELGGVMIVTADHGNVETMLDAQGKAMTSHTCNPVNLFIRDFDYKGDYVIDTSVEHPGLANVTATYINLLGFETPEMYKPSLIKFL